MRRFLLAIILLAAPLRVIAMPAPTGCADHFLDGEMPDHSPVHAPLSEIICLSGFAVFHSGQTKTPLWSAQRLTPAGVAAANSLSRPKPGPFHAEKRIAPLDRAELKDYKGTGFDRGHMAPNGDMPTKEAQRDSFSLANIIPQQACNNEETWEGVESGVRKFVASGHEVVVITGPIFDPTFPPGSAASIGDGVAVPTRIFKALVYVASRTGAAYLVENVDTKIVNEVPISVIQAATGIDLFPTLDRTSKEVASYLPPPSAPSNLCRLPR